MNKQESGIDQLIQRIKTEAVDKAARERDEIIQQAEAQAKTIIDAAIAKSGAYVAEARDYIAKEKHKMAQELEMAARDFAVKLAQRLKDQMMFAAVRENVRLTLKEPQFLQDVLQRLIIDYVKHNSCNLDVLVPKELKTSLAAFFASAIFDRLDKNSDIRLLDEEGLEGFVLIKRGEHYVWDFRVETISVELMRLIEPSLKKYFITKTARSPEKDLSKPVEAGAAIC